MIYNKQLRATFEDTKKAQEELRNKLDTLEKKNAFITEDERGPFFALIANALLGCEYDKICNINFPNGTCIQNVNVGEFIRYIAYNNEISVKYNILKKYRKITDINVKMSDVWKELKFILFKIYPEALATSIKMSKEREKKEGSQGAPLDDEEG